MIVCSATLHAFEVKKMAVNILKSCLQLSTRSKYRMTSWFLLSQERLMHFPTWVDLKGEDAVPETVHHVVVSVDPQKDKSWHNMRSHVETDGVHARDNVRPGNSTAGKTTTALRRRNKLLCENSTSVLLQKRCRKLWRSWRESTVYAPLKSIKWTERWYFAERNSTVTIWRDLWGIPADSSFHACACTATESPRSVRPIWRNSSVKRWSFWYAPTWRPEDWTSTVCLSVSNSRANLIESRGNYTFNIVVCAFPVINVTLPDEKSNYVHRIGRVGRAERMGLAISLVSSVPEKVWYHGEWCSSRGRNCFNTNLTNQGGCCTWYNEPQVSFRQSNLDTRCVDLRFLYGTLTDKI